MKSFLLGFCTGSVLTCVAWYFRAAIKEKLDAETAKAEADVKAKL